MIALLHAVPTNFLSLSAVDAQELAAKAKGPAGEIIRARHDGLQKYLGDETDEAIEVVRKLWEARLVEVDIVLQVYEAVERPSKQLSAEEEKLREGFFEKSTNAWMAARDVLVRLERDMIGPYTLGRSNCTKRHEKLTHLL